MPYYHWYVHPLWARDIVSAVRKSYHLMRPYYVPGSRRLKKRERKEKNRISELFRMGYFLQITLNL